MGFSGKSTFKILKMKQLMMRQRNGYLNLQNQHDVIIKRNKNELDFSEFCLKHDTSPPIRSWTLPNKDSVLSLHEVNTFMIL